MFRGMLLHTTCIEMAAILLLAIFISWGGVVAAEDEKPHRENLKEEKDESKAITLPPAPEVGDWGYWQINLSAPFIVPDPHLDPNDIAVDTDDKGKDGKDRLTQKLELVLVVNGITGEGLSVRQERKNMDGKVVVRHMTLEPESIWDNLVLGNNRKVYNGGDEARTTVAGKAYPARHSEITIPSLAGEDKVYKIEEITGYNLGPARLHGPGVQITLLAFGDASTKPHTLVAEPEADGSKENKEMGANKEEPEE